tara:strand:- start:180 stop:311 length:132 start_codon:yes stop_codon:yes gene_type:complete
MNRRIRKLKRMMRRLEWWERIHLMDWNNAWYSDRKMQQQREEE